MLDRLVSGELTLTAVGLLRQHLTPENHREILDAARHKSKREIEVLVARLSPQPAIPSSILDSRPLLRVRRRLRCGMCRRL